MTALTPQQARNLAAATEARMGALPPNWSDKVGWNGQADIAAASLIDGLEAIYRGRR